MNRYLRAIGYGNITSKKELKGFLKNCEEFYDYHELIEVEKEFDFCEYQRECGAGIGISVCGDMDMEQNFQRQYYYPYFIGSSITSYADVEVEKRMDRDAFVGICEDDKMGISIIFYLQNMVEFLKEKQKARENIHFGSVTLSGLCNKATILLPILKNKEAQRKSEEEAKKRMSLLSAAKNGDPSAIENLTLEDIDIYSKVSKRLTTEDVFSIVDTCFMPSGIECDCYSILGKILEIHTIENEDTSEKIYIMKVDVNGLEFDICIPKKGLVGEPAVGRRIKGNIWLQGRINFKRTK